MCGVRNFVIAHFVYKQNWHGKKENYKKRGRDSRQ